MKEIKIGKKTEKGKNYRMNVQIKKTVLIILCICLAVAFVPSGVYADEQYEYVEGRFIDHDQTVTWEYPYSDEFFYKPSDKYDHDFARLSMGLAIAAFRDEKQPEAEDHFLIEFLESMGFSGIETETYRTKPTADSISYGLARKKIGDMTVLTCAVCGFGYGKEWASNLTVGDFERSQGFNEAAEKVEAAIEDYMERNITDEKVKLWIAGYSRAAAVSNITAADCTESGRFEDVYAYTFATPRTTRAPVAYPNIFNIINKDDLVPKIPLSDWGYERFGNDMYIVSPETDSNFGDILIKAEEEYRKMFSAELVNNPEITYELRILFDYLLMLNPDAAVYSEFLQPLMIKFMTEEDGMEEALSVLFKALNEYRTEDPVIGEELSALLDYLTTMIATYYMPEAVANQPPSLWDPVLGTVNLFYSHLAPGYLAYLYSSDDTEELYSDNTEYIKLIIYGNVDVSVSDGSTVVKEILSDGTELVDGVPAPYSFPDANCYDNKVVITLPSDKSYDVTLTSKSLWPQTISYTGLAFSGDTLRAKADDLYSYIMFKGQTAVIRTAYDGRAIEPTGSDHTDISVFTEALYSPTTAMRMENNRIYHLNISGFSDMVMLLIVLLTAQLVASIILLIRRRKKHLKRNVKVTLIWHGLMLFVFMTLEFGFWYFVPFISILKTIASIVVGIIIFVYALKGCREQNTDWKFFRIYSLVLAAFMVLQNLLLGKFMDWKAIMLIIVYGLFMTVAYDFMWHKDRNYIFRFVKRRAEA